MSRREVLLDRTRILQALRDLAERLRRRNLVATVYLFGGAAIVLAFDERGATRDLDARFTSTSAVLDEVRAVAEALGLPRSWLNEQGTMYLPRADDPHPDPVFDHANLRVLRASDRHLLAMKAAAARRNTADVTDIALLARHLGVDDPREVVRIHDEVFPDEPLDDAKVAVIEEALAAPTRPGGATGPPGDEADTALERS
jgi:hypothetical protein